MKRKANNKEYDIARTLMILRNYEWLKVEANAVGVRIIPLKGIDLLQNLYSNNLNRLVSDIDILCGSEDDCRLLVERLCREDYKVEFKFAMNHRALSTKKKVSLISTCTTKVNVDLHIAFITKKFFSETVGTFNSDALARCHDGFMDEIDRWLYLAQHAAFHIYADDKWIEDLKLLYNDFSVDKKVHLFAAANRYGFRRVVLAALYKMFSIDIKKLNHEMGILVPSKGEEDFLSFIKHFKSPFTRSIYHRFISAFWEFIYIDKNSNRLKAILKLIFPSLGMITNIYRVKNSMTKYILYPFHLLLSVSSNILFWSLYKIIVIAKDYG